MLIQDTNKAMLDYRVRTDANSTMQHIAKVFVLQTSTEDAMISIQTPTPHRLLVVIVFLYKS